MKLEIKKGLSEEDANTLSTWSNKKGEEFQSLWMGNQVSFPLTVEKLISLEDVYSIFISNEFTGSIQKIRYENDNVHIGRFIINPNRTGEGIGAIALNKFIEMIFTDGKFNTISLTVAKKNTRARKLYEKLGFRYEQSISNHNEIKYTMKKYRAK